MVGSVPFSFNSRLVWGGVAIIVLVMAGYWLGSGLFSTESIMFRGGPHNIGKYTSSDIDLNSEVNFRFNDGGFGIVVSTPAVSDRSIFFGKGSKLYAIDKESRKVEWTFQTDGEVFSSPAFAENNLYFGSTDGKIYAVGARKGEEIWSVETDGRVVSSPSVNNGSIYIGSNDNKVYSIKKNSGEIEWSVKTDGDVESSPAVLKNTVYVGSKDDNLYAINSESGKIRWQFRTGGDVTSPPSVYEGRVYFGSSDGIVYCVGSSSGDKKWSFDTGKPIISPLSIGKKRIYVRNNYPRVTSLNMKNGSKEWTYELSNEASSTRATNAVSGPVVIGGLLYYTEGSSMHVIDKNSGEQKKSIDIPGEITSSIVPKDSTIYFGGINIQTRFSYAGLPRGWNIPDDTDGTWFRTKTGKLRPESISGGDAAKVNLDAGYSDHDRILGFDYYISESDDGEFFVQKGDDVIMKNLETDSWNRRYHKIKKGRNQITFSYAKGIFAGNELPSLRIDNVVLGNGSLYAIK